MIELQTPRLIVRDPVWEDLPAHHALLSDPAAMRYLDDIRTHSPEESEENLRRSIAEAASGARTCYFLTMEERATGAYVGQIGYTVRGRAEVGAAVDAGYFIRPAFWGRGYVPEALEAVLRYAFEDGGIWRVGCGCLRENGASERVMRKCGLIREAELRDWALHEGKWKDRVVYRLLRPEWEALCCKKTS